MTEYQTIAGTEPSAEEKHEPRTIKRVNLDSTVYMMTEIEDGAFVQWSTCAGCGKSVVNCTDKDGPVEPDYIKRWRTKRFENSFGDRLKTKRKPRPAAESKTDADWVDFCDKPSPHPAHDNCKGVPMPPTPSDTRPKVDDGLSSALDAVRAKASKEEKDVGF